MILSADQFQGPPPVQKTPQGDITGQLPLFMSAREIMMTHQPLYGEQMTEEEHNERYGYVPDDLQGVETNDQMAARKARDAAVGGWKDAVLAEGVHVPISLGMSGSYVHPHTEPGWYSRPGMSPHDVVRPFILDGHHRVVIHLDEAPDRFLPVAFYVKGADQSHDFDALMGP